MYLQYSIIASELHLQMLSTTINSSLTEDNEYFFTEPALLVALKLQGSYIVLKVALTKIPTMCDLDMYYINQTLNFYSIEHNLS